MDKKFEKENIFGLGDENVNFAKYFIGKSYLNPLTNPNCFFDRVFIDF